MPPKNFEQVISFYEHQLPNGDVKYFPLVTVTFITPPNNRFSLSLLFDTGADYTTLRYNFFHVLGLNSWDEGQRIDLGGVGGSSDAYLSTGTLEVFGKTISCPILLTNRMAPNPLINGLLGRNTVFNEFGFGFWENTKELYVTPNP